MTRALSFFAIFALLVACESTPSETPAPESGEPVARELSPCCQETLARFAEMPACCQEGMSTPGAFTGCCTEGMKPETADADRPACCAQSMAIVAELSPCCRTTLRTGEPDECCVAMPAALASREIP